MMVIYHHFTLKDSLVHPWQQQWGKEKHLKSCEWWFECNNVIVKSTKPQEQVNVVEIQTGQKNGKRRKLHLLHGSQGLLPVWTGIIKRRKDWKCCSWVIIHVIVVLAGGFESHSPSKCSKLLCGWTQRSPYILQQKVSVTRLLPTCHQPRGLIPKVLARGTAGQQGAFPTATRGWWRGAILESSP